MQLCLYTWHISVCSCILPCYYPMVSNLLSMTSSRFAVFFEGESMLSDEDLRLELGAHLQETWGLKRTNMEIYPVVT